MTTDQGGPRTFLDGAEGARIQGGADMSKGQGGAMGLEARGRAILVELKTGRLEVLQLHLAESMEEELNRISRANRNWMDYLEEDQMGGCRDH